MVQFALARRRSWTGLGGALVIIAGAVILLALGHTIVPLAAMAAAAGLLMLHGRASTRAATPERTAAASIAAAPRAQRSVRKADGTARQGLLVPAKAVEGYQTVLTIDGYVLVNAEGQVVYALSRKAHDDTGEPVVVTILEEELAA